MKVIVDIAIIPLGVGLSLSKYVAECEKIFKDAGLKSTLHANGTNIEGEWDDVFAVVKNATSEFTKWVLQEYLQHCELGQELIENKRWKTRLKAYN